MRWQRDFCVLCHLEIKATGRCDELSDIRDTFVACCVLHNMLLAYDAAVVRDEAQDASFGLHDHAEVLGSRIRALDFASSASTADIIVHPHLDVSGTGSDNAPSNIPFFFHDGSSEPRHYTLRNALSRHLSLSTDEHRN